MEVANNNSISREETLRDHPIVVAAAVIEVVEEEEEEEVEVAVQVVEEVEVVQTAVALHSPPVVHRPLVA